MPNTEQRVDYSGPATRASDNSPVEITGTFVATDNEDGSRTLTDARVHDDDFPGDFEPDTHTYIVAKAKTRTR